MRRQNGVNTRRLRPPSHCNFAGPDTYTDGGARALEAACEPVRCALSGDLIVMVPIDFLFLGVVAKGFFASQVGDMLGEIRPAPAILFYLLYVGRDPDFCQRFGDGHWRSTLLYGALFGFFCYATFELTSLSLLKHWTWPVVIVDVAWGSVVTALRPRSG